MDSLTIDVKNLIHTYLNKYDMMVIKNNIDDIIICECVKSGYLSILKWLHINFASLNTDNILDYYGIILCSMAADNDHFDTLQWLVNNGCMLHEDIPLSAVRGGQFEILQCQS